MECLPADKPWDVVSATRQSSGVSQAPGLNRRGPMCACTRVCWCRRIFTYIHTDQNSSPGERRGVRSAGARAASAAGRAARALGVAAPTDAEKGQVARVKCALQRLMNRYG